VVGHVHDPPTLRPLDAVPADEDPLSGGHLWLRELLTGPSLRFTVADSGLLEFAVGDRRLAEDRAPLPVRAAVDAVRAGFDRDAFRAAVDEPGDVTFLGVATRFEGVPYEFDRLPAFVGTDVHDAGPGRFLPVDRSESAFERLGLAPAPALAKEVRTRDFRPDRYEFPPSPWYDGPVAGVVLRNRDGTRGLLRNPEVTVATGVGEAPEPAALAATLDAGRVRAALEAAGGDVDRAADRLLAALVRREYGRLFAGGDGRPRPRVDLEALSAATARRVREAT
jgi:hypothetical protein